MKKIILIGGLLILLIKDLPAQIYVETGNGSATVDLCSCETGPIVDPTATSALAVGPDLNLYYIVSGEIFRYNVTTGVQTFLGSFPPTIQSVTFVYGPNGLLYTIADDFVTGEVFLYSINPTTGFITNLGLLPPGYLMQGDLFFYNGLLYALAADFSGLTVILQVPLNNPGASSAVFTYATFSGNVGAVTVIINGIPTVLVLGVDLVSGESGLFELNMNTGEYTLICAGIDGGDLGAPPNYVVPPCCNNEAGSFVETNLVTACGTAPISLMHNGDEVLNPDASLSFVLVSDTNAILPAGLIQIGATPNFNFSASTITYNTIYYVAAVAAPGAVGAPAWNSTCKDISFFTPVVWRPKPAVTFTIANPSVCAGQCTDITASFTGTAPFTLSYSISFAGTTAFTSAGSSAVFQVCVPDNAPLGIFSVQALSLSDVQCVCE
jgi:hypothetical protein